MRRGVLPERLPPNMPQFAPHAGRRIARGFLRLAGWKLVGEFPDVAKLVLIVAPHSSWWDGFWGLMFKAALGADLSFMAKREVFDGLLGPLLRRLGGVPVDRAAAHGAVMQMAERLRHDERFWLCITPEGTRKQVAQWKTGFWRIARAANVPILPVWFDYPDRTVGIGALMQPGSDLDADIARLRAFYAPRRGRHHGVD
ncbi:MAG: 1-acyl-sn-glycerol-3-phosphate acyltransferase [Rhodanobacteraceae bacterium]